MKPQINPDQVQCAELVSRNLRAWYGLEDGAWKFTADFDGINVTIPKEKLQVPENADCDICLLIGISWLLMKYHLTL